MDKEKNKDLITSLIELHEGHFYKLAYTYLRNHEDAQDVLHNAYEIAYLKQDQVRDKKKAKAWLLTIIRNEANGLIKRNVLGRQKALDHYQDQAELTNSSDVASQVDLKEALNHLDKDQRDLVVMKYLLGYKQREISEILGIPKGTVKSKTSRALEALRHILGGDYNE